MLGNVYEWTGDWYNATYPGTVTDPLGAGSGSNRVTRGGSWYNFARFARAAFRSSDTPVDRNYGLGFRLSRTAP
jgi:formylglycine-generating enzyme required for sulfatase activity